MNIINSFPLPEDQIPKKLKEILSVGKNTDPDSMVCIASRFGSNVSQTSRMEIVYEDHQIKQKYF